MPGDRVLEIGPGPGALTDIIHSRGPAEFRLIEKDGYWAGHHATRGLEAPEVKVLNADALAFPWESLEGPWKIISNLPYNVGSPLIWDMVSRCRNLSEASSWSRRKWRNVCTPDRERTTMVRFP